MALNHRERQFKQVPKAQPLNERAQHLLKVLVERYIEEGLPVGSRSLSKDAGLNLSPATIRNVMADLEDLGFITAPHTSAGRMPTASGYRFFIDTLLTVKPLHQDLIQKLEVEIRQKSSPSNLLETASRLLSETTHMASLVMLPKTDTQTFSHIEFVPLSEQRLLVILVSGQQIHNKVIEAPRNFTPEELRVSANFLNHRFAGKDIQSIKDALISELQKDRERLSQELLDAAALGKLALTQQQDSRNPLMVSGEINLMDFTELADLEYFRGLFETLHQKEEMLRLMERCIDSPGIKIFVGRESGHRALDQCSLVTSTYRINDQPLGVLGVIGPTRMEYERVIQLVDITAKLVGAALNQQTLPPL